jgi:hypothetical protein
MPRFIHRNLIALIILSEERKLLLSGICFSPRPFAAFSPLEEVKFSLSTALTHIGGVEVQLHTFLDSAVVELSGLLHAQDAFTPGKNPGAH